MNLVHRMFLVVIWSPISYACQGRCSASTLSGHAPTLLVIIVMSAVVVIAYEISWRYAGAGYELITCMNENSGQKLWCAQRNAHEAARKWPGMALNVRVAISTSGSCVLQKRKKHALHDSLPAFQMHLFRLASFQ